MTDKTIFSKIIDREVPGKVEYTDEHCIVLRDINPQAPIHFLIIPKKPIPQIAKAEPEDQLLLGHLLIIAQKMSRQYNLEDGFRVVINNGKKAGETVPHLHIHLLAGRGFSWPPG